MALKCRVECRSEKLHTPRANPPVPAVRGGQEPPSQPLSRPPVPSLPPGVRHTL